jgi:hypothetical protein
LERIEMRIWGRSIELVLELVEGREEGGGERTSLGKASILVESTTILLTGILISLFKRCRRTKRRSMKSLQEAGTGGIYISYGRMSPVLFGRNLTRNPNRGINSTLLSYDSLWGGKFISLIYE